MGGNSTDTSARQSVGLQARTVNTIAIASTVVVFTAVPFPSGAKAG
jgi:hypothetical protein